MSLYADNKSKARRFLSRGKHDKIDASLTKTRHLKASGSHLDREDVRFNFLPGFIRKTPHTRLNITSAMHRVARHFRNATSEMPLSVARGIPLSICDFTGTPELFARTFENARSVGRNNFSAGWLRGNNER